MQLNDQTVVITGASSGLGKAIAFACAKRGATVVLLARCLGVLQHVQAQVSALSGKPAYAYALDVADPTMCQAVAKRVLAQVPQVDVLVNAAGFGHFEAALETSPKVIEAMFRTNVLGTMYMTRLFGRAMIAQGRGHIINIASMAGKMATPKSAIYSASKFAVVGFSNGLRLELKPLGVKVTTVNPGPINTNFFAVAKASDYLQSVKALALDPDKLAARIVNAFNKPVREINAPGVMAVAAVGYNLLPHLGDWLAGGMFNKK
ncbi:SDR family NAD(P)-dependent oxidoreductase [Lacticaseibacillus jixiensis]|uniref:SDR family NAD(P)-dependent oxidoreductase n=1 Tax=Lacticaseibacillus jixiensis TaxID=3231926 RepID=UPI0036F300DC